MKNVLLKFYSRDNLGDDLFIKIITERYKDNFSTVLEKNNPTLSAIKNLHVYKNFLKLFIYRLIGKVQKQHDLWLNDLSKKHDLLVYIGGSLFIEGPDSREFWTRQRAFFKGLSIPYFIIGSNYGPQLSTHFYSIIKNIFEGAEDVCFRDTATYTLFSDLPNTRAATDIAFSMDISKYKKSNKKLAIFSIVNCENRFDANTANKYDDEIRNMSMQLIDSGYEITYMSFCEAEGDKIAIDRIMSKLEPKIANKIKVFNYNGNLEAGLEHMAECEILIGTRFHATILGLLFSKKVLPIAYSKKTTNILKDMKFKGEVIDINNIEHFDGSSFNFDTLKVNDVSGQIKLAELQFKVLDKYLTRKLKNE